MSENPSSHSNPQHHFLPIVLGVSRPRCAEIPFWSILRTTKDQKSFKEAILRRDFHSCRFCGFQSQKYQEVVVREGKDWDIDNAATACVFCAQCMTLEKVRSMRSGVLISAPELSQANLHHLARLIYTCRISQGYIADKARQALDLLMSKRLGDEDKKHSDDPGDLERAFYNCNSYADYLSLQQEVSDLRLFPLDRRIIKEADLEFNQFPQILAFWRSSNGSASIRGKVENLNISILDDFLESEKATETSQ